MFVAAISTFAATISTFAATIPTFVVTVAVHRRRIPLAPPASMHPDSKGPTFQTRPPRMRSACTECHAAKVRCSGERTGCSRCNRNGLSCHFKESMVGRMSKRQKRTNIGQSQTSNDRDTTCSAADDVGSEDSIEALDRSNPEQQRLSVSISDSLLMPQWPSPVSVEGSSDYDMHSTTIFNWDWAAPVPSEKGKSPRCDTAHHRQQQQQSLDLNIHSLPMMLFDGNSPKPPSYYDATTTLADSPGRSSRSIDRISSSKPMATETETTPKPTPTNSLQTATSTVATAQRGDAKFGHLATLCRIAHGLEGRDAASPLKSSSLDELMRIVRASMNDTAGAMRRDECRRCTCSSMMVLSILDLLLNLFEQMIQLLGLDHPGQDRGGSDGGSGSGTCCEGGGKGGGGRGGERGDQRCPALLLPTLQFGVFKLDPEEQADVARSLVCKELRRLLGIFQTFSACCQVSATSDGRNMLGQWYGVLKGRLERLVSVAGRRGDHVNSTGNFS